MQELSYSALVAWLSCVMLLVVLALHIRRAASITSTPTNRPQRPLCILSMDGGGIKGVVLATVLEALQGRTELPISRLFDLIVGTSTGGVAAVHLAFTKSPTEALRDYRASLEYVRRVLCRRSKLQLCCTGFECTARDARHVARSTMPVKQFGPLPPPQAHEMAAPHGAAADIPHTTHVAVVTARLGSGGVWEPFLLRNYHTSVGEQSKLSDAEPHSSASSSDDGAADWSVENMVLATTAAPMLFPPFELGAGSFVDGAIVYQNPTPLALREARRIWPGRPLGLVVSLGTGQLRREAARMSSPLYWISTMLNMAFDSNRVHREIQDTLLPAIASECSHPFYFRLSPVLESGTMVSSSPEEVAGLVRQAEHLVKQKARELDQIAVYLLLATKRARYLATSAGRSEAERLCGPHADPRELSTALKRLRTSGFEDL